MTNQTEELNQTASEFMTRAAVAKYVGVGLQTVAAIQKNDPSFPLPVRIGKRCWWARDDVAAWKRARISLVREDNQRRLESLQAPAKKSRRQ